MRLYILLLGLLACPLCLAGPKTYEELLLEARRLQAEQRPGDVPGSSLDRAYDKLAEAARLDPERWEAFAMRGTNRCELAVVWRSALASRLNTMQARGASAEELEDKQTGGMALIESRIAQGQQNFDAMAIRMRRSGRNDAGMLRFAKASVKFARGHYLKTPDGKPGAIDDLKSLVRQNWRPERCAEFAALCYNELGAIALVRDTHEKAQEYWDEALKWAQSENTKRRILTNKAGAFESSGNFELAKQILREQIAREPYLPSHWKNLGLLLGFEGSLREALDAYAKVRELCEKAQTPFFLGLLHGSAWLKTSMIHGKLLKEDGDLLVAWRLFLEYRQMFGDDYNFCFNFGSFAFHLGAYETAHVFLTRARDLQPFCRIPHIMLLQVAQRLPGTSDEIRERVAKAQVAAEEARKRNPDKEASPRLRRLCAGLVDRSDNASVAGQGQRIEPDPLEGFDFDKLPEWIKAAAEKRSPFRPYDPAIDDVKEQEAADEPPVEYPKKTVSRWWIWICVGLVVLIGLRLVLRLVR